MRFVGCLFVFVVLGLFGWCVYGLVVLCLLRSWWGWLWLLVVLVFALRVLVEVLLVVCYFVVCLLMGWVFWCGCFGVDFIVGMMVGLGLGAGWLLCFCDLLLVFLFLVVYVCFV